MLIYDKQLPYMVNWFTRDIYRDAYIRQTTPIHGQLTHTIYIKRCLYTTNHSHTCPTNSHEIYIEMLIYDKQLPYMVNWLTRDKKRCLYTTNNSHTGPTNSHEIYIEMLIYDKQLPYMVNWLTRDKKRCLYTTNNSHTGPTNSHEIYIEMLIYDKQLPYRPN